MSEHSFHRQLRGADLSKKELWLQAFTAALHRLPSAEAVREADEALRLCDARWSSPELVGTLNFKHDYSVGYVFPVIMASSPPFAS